MTWWGSLVRVQSRLPNSVEKTRAWRIARPFVFGGTKKVRFASAAARPVAPQTSTPGSAPCPLEGRGGRLGARGAQHPLCRFPGLNFARARQGEPSPLDRLVVDIRLGNTFDPFCHMEVEMSVVSRFLIASVSSEPLAASWRKLVGIALLWSGLASLMFVATAGATSSVTLVALLGFAAFAAGLMLFAEGLKLSIVAAVASSPSPSAQSRRSS